MKLITLFAYSFVYCISIHKVSSAVSGKANADDSGNSLVVWVKDAYGLKLLNQKKLAKGYYPDLEPYGYVFTFDDAKNPPKEIKVGDTKLNIPNGAKNLLITLPESSSGKNRQDIQVMSFPGMQPPKFVRIELNDRMMAIYIQYKKTPNTASHGAPKEEKRRTGEFKEKEGDSSKNERKKVRMSRKYKTRSRKLLNQKIQDEVIDTIRDLFSKDSNEENVWPAIQYGVVSDKDFTQARVQQVQHLPNDQSSNVNKFFILQFFPNTFHFIKVQNKIISLNRILEKAYHSDNPLIRLDIKVEGFEKEKNDAPVIKRESKTGISLVDKGQLSKLNLSPEQLGETNYILQLRFINVKPEAESDEEDFT